METLENRFNEIERRLKELEINETYTKDLEFQLTAIKEENEYNFIFSCIFCISIFFKQMAKEKINPSKGKIRKRTKAAFIYS